MGLFETIADRRIREARAKGMFDNLPGKGKPIPDLGTERPAGWWAARVVKEERDKATRELLVSELKRSVPSLWRLSKETEVHLEVARLNDKISEYNRDTSDRTVEPLDVEDVMDRWHGARAYR